MLAKKGVIRGGSKFLNTYMYMARYLVTFPWNVQIGI